jgi:hypothetical protein
MPAPQLGVVAESHSLERVAFTWDHATRSTSLLFEHLHTFR